MNHQMISCALFRASNLVALDYPFDAALASALQICDRAAVVLGSSRDGSRDWVYALQREHGADRVLIREETWRFDRTWQERCWDWAAGMTAAEWLLHIDADEVFHEDDVPAIRELMENPEIKLIRFPFIHLYATPRFHYVAPGFLRWNTRLGRRSAGFRMRNWCSDVTPNHAVCQMVYGPDEHNAHVPADGVGMATVGAPVYHYGWARSAEALAISQAKHRAWYADGGDLADGRIPDVAPWDFRLAAKLASGEAERFDGDHPAVMAAWFEAHADEWTALEDACAPMQ